MRIGVDATCWANPRGYGRYARELLRALAEVASDHRLLLFADPLSHDTIDLRAPHVRRVRVQQSAAPTRAAAAGGNRSPLDMLRLTWAVRRAALDVFLFPSVYTFFPLPPGLPAAVVIHDAIAERYPERTLPSARARLFWRAKVRLALWQTRRVLTVSEFSRNDLTRVLQIPRDRLRVTLEAPAAAFRPTDDPQRIARAAAGVGLPPGARWLVYVGGFNPHKNVDVLVRAHAALARQLGPETPHLLLVGSIDGDVFHQGLETIRAAIEQAGTGALIHWTGFLPDDELRHLHSGALALVLPSDCEGFGLPAVEAAACGAPVVATTESPLPDLLRGGGRFVPPRDEAALTAALHRLATREDERAAMGRAARHRAAELSWQSSAREVLRALEECVR